MIHIISHRSDYHFSYFLGVPFFPFFFLSNCGPNEDIPYVMVTYVIQHSYVYSFMSEISAHVREGYFGAYKITLAETVPASPNFSSA